MSRSSWIKSSIKRLIAAEAYNNPQVPRQALFARLKRIIEEMGEVPPSKETTYKLISDGRRTPRKFTELWTMASLINNSLPSDSIPWVLKVWRYAINTGENFNVGQAEWVSRLYVMFNDITLLWYWSYLYAHEERASIVINEEMDSYPLDSSLMLGKWENDALIITGFHDKPIKYGLDLFLYRDKDGAVIEELLHGIKPGNPWRDEHYNERDLKLSLLVQKLPALQHVGMSDEAKMVYLRWFTHLTKGPQWHHLSPEEALNIIKKLRELIIYEQEYRLSDDARKGFAETFNFSSPNFSSGIRELLTEVGYEVT